MQIRCKPGGLEDKGPKIESGFNSKIMQKHSKLGSLKDRDPINKISKINFISWIRDFYKYLYIFVSCFFLKDQDPKIKSRFSPKIMQICYKIIGLEDQDPKIKSRFSPKIMQIYYKIIGLEDQDPKIKFRFNPKIMQINCKQGDLEMFGGSGSKN